MNFHFFLETSKSTDAYLAPNKSRFKTAVNLLAAFLNTHDGRKSFNIWEVSNIAYPIFVPAGYEEANRYFSGLSPRAVEQHIAKVKGASRSTSDLSGIISTVLEKTGSEDVSVLVTDCVVDTKSNGSNLSAQQAALQTIAARRRAKSPFAMLFLRDTSEFEHGAYYVPDGGTDELTGYRPYFIIVMGNATAVQKISEELAAKDPQFRQSALLGASAATPKASLKPSKLGHYEIEGSPGQLIATEAKLAGPRNNFLLQLEADLSEVPAQEAYKNDRANYEVTGGPYTISVAPEAQQGYTHTFTLTSTELGAKHTVHVRLRNSLPAWVQAASSDNSGPIRERPDELSKTYGLYHIIKGLSEGINPGNYLFELPPIEVKR